MITGRVLAIVLMAAVVAGGIGGAALGDDGPTSGEALEAVDLRKDDAQSDAELVDDDEDDDPTGDRDDASGDRDGTLGDDGTGGGDNTADGDDTTGNDGTDGGDGTGNDASAGNGGDGTLGGPEATDDGDQVAAAPVPAPAPAPVYDDYSDDGGYAVSGT